MSVDGLASLSPKLCQMLSQKTRAAIRERALLTTFHDQQIVFCVTW